MICHYGIMKRRTDIMRARQFACFGTIAKPLLMRTLRSSSSRSQGNLLIHIVGPGLLARHMPTPPYTSLVVHDWSSY